ncbi:MAG: hypothetical protein AVDCRST_MAG73-4208 [uncultured Thermomicrobiales bacterium]|uniref:PI3K/PI4K catalytic domain-containing protein n=1 Tax=uncultured Thermomicrobiales bacterium TaxID=1645740 RepID=A0A6J4V0Y0_9BACT|nr:MAG: hypothetical protein AVDCRST_MAG73-4208 [uncultured Thermomicrobiales bacterium]
MPDLFLELRDDDEGAGFTPAPPLTEDAALDLLREADFTAAKLIPWGSNYTFAVGLECPDGREQLAIYKPRAGEAPLYDFPDGSLYRREVASFALSRALGWRIVPPTVVREDGPNGVGSLQLYVEPTPDSPELRRFWGSCAPEIERLVLFDHVANNADRKIGHCLRDPDGKVWGIDHGLTFSRQPKLRTVLWQFVGQPISPPLLADLRRLRLRSDEVGGELASFLDNGEIAALWSRVDRMLETGHYPHLNPRRNVPYGWW